MRRSSGRYDDIIQLPPEAFSLRLASSHPCKNQTDDAILGEELLEQCLEPPQELPEGVRDFSAPFRRDINTSHLSKPRYSSTVEDKTRAFLVHNLCTPAECEYIVHTAEPFMQDTSPYFAQRHRVSERAMIMSDDVARDLFARLLPHIRAEDYRGRIPLCFGQGGAWVPVRLNNCLKVVKYSPGGTFSQHRDGPWIPREDEASIFTVLLYLNTLNRQSGRYEVPDGRTVLLGDVGQVGRANYFMSAPPINVTPVAGTALIFNHECLHMGALCQKPKYVLRTEIIFRRSHAAYVDRYLYRDTEEYARTRQLYDESMAAMEAGDKEKFFLTYQEVVVEQQRAMLSTMKKVGPAAAALGTLGPNVTSLIVSFCGLQAVVPLMLVSHATYFMIVQLPLWHNLCCEQYPDVMTGFVNRCLLAAAVGEKQPSTLLIDAPFPFVPKDWMTIYSQLLLFDRHFDPVVVLLSTGDPMINISKAAAVAESPDEWDDRRRYRTRGLQPRRFRVQGTPNPLIPSCMKVLPCWYTEIDRHAALHMNVPLGEQYDLDTHDDGTRSVSDTAVWVDWSFLSIPIEVVANARMAPFALIGCPHWYAQGPNSNPADADLASQLSMLKVLFLEQTRAPGVVILHPAVLASAAPRLLTSRSGHVAADHDEDLLQAIARSAAMVSRNVSQQDVSEGEQGGADDEDPSAVTTKTIAVLTKETHGPLFGFVLRMSEDGNVICDAPFVLGQTLLPAASRAQELCNAAVSFVDTTGAEECVLFIDSDEGTGRSQVDDELEALIRTCPHPLVSGAALLTKVDILAAASVVCSSTILFRQLCTFRI